MVSLRSLFSREPEPLLGMDISSASVKLVELGRNKDGELVLERCALEVLEPGWVVGGNIEKFDEVAAAIQRLVKKSGTQAKNVAMALAPSLVITKKITLPAGRTDEELEVLVEAEGNQYIPFAMEEVNLDFCVLGPAPKAADEVEVLIAASRRERVQDIQGLAEAAGLKPVVIDLSSLAIGRVVTRLARAWEEPVAPAKPLIALLKLGAQTTSMLIIQNEEVLYERDQAFGGAQLTQALMSQYGYTYMEAEQKKRSGDLPQDFGVNVLRPFIDNLMPEIGRSIQFFFASSPFNKIDLMLLAGGTAALPRLSQVVAEQTSIPCRVVNPFEGMLIGDGVRQGRMANEVNSYMTACGLALRRFLP
ncbi:MAG: pilus assembly protein PilM [Hylemonella sp.]